MAKSPGAGVPVIGSGMSGSTVLSLASSIVVTAFGHATYPPTPVGANDDPGAGGGRGEENREQPPSATEAASTSMVATAVERLVGRRSATVWCLIGPMNGLTIASVGAGPVPIPVGRLRT